jgi:hypothetical protein
VKAIPLHDCTGDALSNTYARAEMGAILNSAWDFSSGVHVSPILDRPSVNF